MEKFTIYQVGPVLDSTTSNDEQSKIVDLIVEEHSIALDLSQCTYVSSAGLRVMLFAYKLAKVKGLKFCLVGVLPDINDVMHMTGFDKFFQFYKTVDEIPQS